VREKKSEMTWVAGRRRSYASLSIIQTGAPESQARKKEQHSPRR
jgi:hypothetical protein